MLKVCPAYKDTMAQMQATGWWRNQWSTDQTAFTHC